MIHKIKEDLKEKEESLQADYKSMDLNTNQEYTRI